MIFVNSTTIALVKRELLEVYIPGNMIRQRNCLARSQKLVRAVDVLLTL